MTRVLRSAAKKTKDKESLSSKLGISQKSKSVKRGWKKTLEVASKDIQKNYIWDISPILSTIFTYIDFKDLVKFNTVCKKWSQLTNPIIHKSIKLLRERAIMYEAHDKRFHEAAKTDAEAGECIANNAKLAPFVKEFTFNEKLEPQRAIEFFETFKFITHLTIKNLLMSQDQFLGMIKPLTRLEELELEHVTIKKIIRKRLYTEVVQLPLTLTKLTLDKISLINHPELFVATISSSSNLVELKYSGYNQSSFQGLFCTSHPSLKIFQYSDQYLKSPGSLVKVFELNPQLLTLKLELRFLNDTLANAIRHYLTNLEELDIAEISDNGQDSLIKLMSSQYTKIKKLKLTFFKLSSCSLSSILLNCPHLEELSLIKQLYSLNDSPLHLSIIKPTKIKKLEFSCSDLSESSIDSILLNCPNLKDLDIQLHNNWKEWIKIIGTRCMNLEQLKICFPYISSEEERDRFFQELYETGFLINSSSYRNTLTHLILERFDFDNSKAEYFEKFPKLKSIKFPLRYRNTGKSIEEIDLNMDSRSNFKLRKYKNYWCNFDIELIKLDT